MPSSLGPLEILVILVVALIVLGPKKLPEAGRQVGRAIAEIRRWSRDIQGEMQGAFDADTYAQPATPPARPEAAAGPVAAAGAVAAAADSPVGAADGPVAAAADGPVGAADGPDDPIPPAPEAPVAGPGEPDATGAGAPPPAKGGEHAPS